jgi:deoxycytidine triphosphate deaminase
MILSGRDLKMYIDIGKLKIAPLTDDQFQQNGIDLVLQSVQYMRNPFWLGCTAETLELPDDLMAFVELRSSWARRGFFLPPTIVDAGFKGNLTLEMLTFMHEPEVAVGKRFAHLIFAKTSSPCEPYTGMYTGQTGITKSKIQVEG